MIALYWANINFTAKTLRVVAGKTESSARTLALPDVLLANLQEHWRWQQAERQVQGVPMRVVMDVLGHAHISTTMDI